MKMVTFIGGNTRIISRKDMEHMIGLVERDTLGSRCLMSHKVMEYSHGQVELYIKDNGNKIRKKVMDIKGGQMAMSIMDSTRMISSTEKDYSKKAAYYTMLNMNKTRLSEK